MDWVNASRSAAEALKKYRFVIVVLFVGLFLMMLPESTQTNSSTVPTVQQKEEDLQSRLEDILSQMHGAGKVRVLLTQSAGERNVFQQNETSEQSETARSLRRETVIVTDSGRGEHGMVQQTFSPVYQGAVILCQGADSAVVRLAIIEAVSSATGLDSSNISVLKMK